MWVMVGAIATVVIAITGVVSAYLVNRRKGQTDGSGNIQLSQRFLSEMQTDVFIKEVNLHPKKVQLLVGFENTLKLAERMMLSAEKELLLISRGEPIPERYDKVLDKVVEKGIPFFFIAFEVGWNNEHIKHYMDKGLNVKYYPTGEFSLLVKDREECYLSVRNPRDTNDRITVHFVDEVVSSSLTQYFHTIWRKALPIEFLKTK